MLDIWTYGDDAEILRTEDIIQISSLTTENAIEFNALHRGRVRSTFTVKGQPVKKSNLFLLKIALEVLTTFAFLL